MNNVILTLTAPTCAGKSFLLDYLDQTGKYQKIPTFTTRAKRAGEIQGVDYFFSDEREFQVVRGLPGGFIEEIEFGGNRYGMPAGYFFERMSQSDEIPVIICTPDGVRIYEEYAKVNGLIHVKAFVFTDDQVRLERLMNRTYKDVKGATDDDGIRKAIHANINRCRDVYVKECDWFGKFMWDVIVEGTKGGAVAEPLISKKIEQLKKLYMS